MKQLKSLLPAAMISLGLVFSSASIASTELPADKIHFKHQLNLAEMKKRYPYAHERYPLFHQKYLICYDLFNDYSTGRYKVRCFRKGWLGRYRRYGPYHYTPRDFCARYHNSRYRVFYSRHDANRWWGLECNRWHYTGRFY